MSERFNTIAQTTYEQIVSESVDCICDSMAGSSVIDYIKRYKNNLTMLTRHKAYAMAIGLSPHTGLLKSSFKARVINTIAKGIIIRVASKSNIKLHEKFMLNDWQKGLIVGLPMHKPTAWTVEDKTKILEAFKAGDWFRNSLIEAKESSSSICLKEFKKAVEVRVNNQTTNKTLEKPMTNFEITKPIMVGNINILTCSEGDLIKIIRRAKEEIDLNTDLAKLSISYQKKEGEMNKVIGLCVTQLDKRFK